MGNFVNRIESPEEMSEISRDYFEVDGANGYLLADKYIPGEIVALILSHVGAEDIVFNCRRVCKSWCNLIDRDVLKLKCMRKNLDVDKLNKLPWYGLYWIVNKEFLNRNLIKNGCGQENFAHWEILSSGGDEWVIEKPPEGCDGFPKQLISEEMLKNNSCFATSYYSCSKNQIIDLKAEGAITAFMTGVQPVITISEWYCGRYDCRSVYEFKITLLDENKDALDEFEIRKNVGGSDGGEWQQVYHELRNYPPEVRYIDFYHGGMDCQFWKGHYGSKMTGASVVLSLP